MDMSVVAMACMYIGICNLVPASNVNDCQYIVSKYGI